ncbi:MAG: CinA family protein [Tenericutes bacterium]|nr:CinA family protein [Mycoplasmatota bacterium]
MKINNQIVEILKKKEYKISTAESITGGALISKIIEVPGASNITEQSYIVYSNQAKVKVLGVDMKLIEVFGVVSEEVALDMARKTKILTNSDIVISITGEAGPNLDNESIAIGTVCFGLIVADEEYTYKQIFTGDRVGIINNSVSYILNNLLYKLV